MANIFLISDTHYGHSNICKFTRADGSPLRPWDDVDIMDEYMIEQWNATVKPNDVVYHLGDVVINRRCLKTLSKLHGDKRLIMGNHDIFDHNEYLPYFKRLHGSFKLGEFMLTHIPLHPDSVGRWATANIHGHIHDQEINHPKYFNVSVEAIEYKPIALEDLTVRVREKQQKFSVDTQL